MNAEKADEFVQKVRPELNPSLFNHDLEGFFWRLGGLVWSFRRDGIIHIAQGDN